MPHPARHCRSATNRRGPCMPLQAFSAPHSPSRHHQPVVDDVTSYSYCRLVKWVCTTASKVCKQLCPLSLPCRVAHHAIVYSKWAQRTETLTETSPVQVLQHNNSPYGSIVLARSLGACSQDTKPSRQQQSSFAMACHVTFGRSLCKKNTSTAKHCILKERVKWAETTF